MADKQVFILRNETIVGNALRAVREAPSDYVVTIAPKTRSTDQNAKFHAICHDLAHSNLTFAGKRRSLEEWKALLISGHAVATGTAGEVVPGLEGEFVAIRESSAKMGVARAASLIEYTLAFCVSNSVDLHDTMRSGFLDERAA